jgi:hypothetical protein
MHVHVLKNEDYLRSDYWSWWDLLLNSKAVVTEAVWMHYWTWSTTKADGMIYYKWFLEVDYWKITEQKIAERDDFWKRLLNKWFFKNLYY